MHSWEPTGYNDLWQVSIGNSDETKKLKWTAGKTQSSYDEFPLIILVSSEVDAFILSLPVFFWFCSDTVPLSIWIDIFQRLSCLWMKSHDSSEFFYLFFKQKNKLYLPNYEYNMSMKIKKKKLGSYY